MNKERKIALVIALVIWVILLAVSYSYIKNLYSSISEKIPSSEAYSQEFINASGQENILSDGDIVSIKLNSTDYSFKMYDLAPTQVKFTVNGFLYFDTNLYELKKLDLDGDYIYDIMIQVTSINDGKAVVVFNQIHESSAGNGNLDQAIERINNSNKLQSQTLIVVSLLFILILIAYLTKAIILPKVEENKKLERKTELETFKELYELFEMCKNKGDTDKANKIFVKAKHLYNYMSEDDKENTKSLFEKMTKYLKENQ